MIATFEAILPIFLLIIAGNLMRRIPLIKDDAWPGLELLGYWFLYPSLLFITVAKADFSNLGVGSLLAALTIATCLIILFMLGIWPISRAAGLIRRSQFSSIFQTSVRWNGFMAFAIAEKLFPPEGLAVVALVMAVIIIPANLASVIIITWFDRGEIRAGKFVLGIITNPLIVATFSALVIRALPFGLYEPLNQTLLLVGQAALGMGLLVIGAGLRPADLLNLKPPMILPVVIKLALYPALLVTVAIVTGVEGPELLYLALCGAVPTAMNGYLLARQMGGDAPLYAAVTTLQTALSFFTIPAVLFFVGQLAGG